MSVVQVPAYATLGAAVIAVAGSIAAVALNGWLVRRAQQRQWDREAVVTRRRVELEACAAFDAAAALSIARFDEIRGWSPGLRRRLLGRDWPRLLYVQLHELGADVVVPYAMVTLVASPEVLAAAASVMAGLTELSQLGDPKQKAAYDAARQRAQDGRRTLGDSLRNRPPD